MYVALVLFLTLTIEGIMYTSQVFNRKNRKPSGVIVVIRTTSVSNLDCPFISELIINLVVAFWTILLSKSHYSTVLSSFY